VMRAKLLRLGREMPSIKQPVSKQYRAGTGIMREPIYNPSIPAFILRSANRACVPAHVSRCMRIAVCCGIILACLGAFAADWNSAQQELARKIVAVTGPGTMTLNVENRSSLGRRDADLVQNGLQTALEQAGVRFVNAEQAAASMMLSLSENQSSYVWVAEIRQGSADSSVVMVSVPRSTVATRAPDSMPMTVRETLVWSGTDRVLDLAILEGNDAPTRIAVLGAENVSLYRMQAGKWQTQQVLAITHAKPWPLDLRGRLLVNKDRSLEAYLPGVICRGAAAAGSNLNCRESDDPWPLAWSGSTSNASAAPALSGFFAQQRNFFTGVISPAIGKFNNVARFYSAAFLPRDKYTLWLFAGTDGNVHMIDGIRDQTSAFRWGSDIATMKTSCGVGWQVLAPAAGAEKNDSVRAYEFPDRDPVAVSAPLHFAGTISALWTEADGDGVIAIVTNRETGGYEAYRVAVACN
jgi:hypothetical protein